MTWKPPLGHRIRQAVMISMEATGRWKTKGGADFYSHDDYDAAHAELELLLHVYHEAAHARELLGSAIFSASTMEVELDPDFLTAVQVLAQALDRQAGSHDNQEPNP